MKILVTGAAGFIWAAVAERLLARCDQVLELDNLNDYDAVSMKESRLALLTPHANFRFVCADVADRDRMRQFFQAEKFERVIHLAAQAGVRYSFAKSADLH